MAIWNGIKDPDHYLCGSHETYWQLEICTDEITDGRCPCDPPGLHILHYRKEPLVKYRGKVWALKCALDDMAYQFQVTRERNEDLVRENRDLRGLCAQNSARIGEMCKYYKQFTSHKEGCAVVEAAMSGRKLDVRCTCGYDYSRGAFIKGK